MDFLNMNPFGPDCPWYSWVERFGEPNVNWCEATVCSVFNEPANTFSNLVYILAAIWIYRTGLKKYGITVFVLGATSFVYHASNNFMTQLFDFVGMFGWGLFLLTWNFERLKWVEPHRRNLLYFGLNIGMIAALLACRLANIPYQILVPLIGVGVIVTEVMLRKVDEGFKKDYRPLFVMLAFLGVAFSFSAMDHKRIFCDPENHWLQGHALWHVFGGIGIWISGLYYRRIPTRPTTATDSTRSG